MDQLPLPQGDPHNQTPEGCFGMTPQQTISPLLHRLLLEMQSIITSFSPMLLVCPSATLFTDTISYRQLAPFQQFKIKIDLYKH